MNRRRSGVKSYVKDTTQRKVIKINSYNMTYVYQPYL